MSGVHAPAADRLSGRLLISFTYVSLAMAAISAAPIGRVILAGAIYAVDRDMTMVAISLAILIVIVIGVATAIAVTV